VLGQRGQLILADLDAFNLDLNTAPRAFGLMSCSCSAVLVRVPAFG